MRNLPLQFVDEKTIEHIEAVQEQQKQEAQPASNWIGRVGQFLWSNLDGDGPRSLANLERALRRR